MPCPDPSREEKVREALPTEEELGHLQSIYEAALGRAQTAEREHRNSGGRLPPEFIVKALFDDAALLLKLAERGDAALSALDGEGRGPTNGGTMDGVALIAAERERQVSEEGWTPEHDDAHGASELARAAACYALPPLPFMRRGPLPWAWPWETAWWKPTPDDRIRELAKAGALLAAEIDRLQRRG